MHNGFYEEPCWVVEWITSGRFFVRALAHLLPPGAILYLECYEEDKGFRSFVAQHRCPESEKEEVFTPASIPPVWTEHLIFGQHLIDSVENFFGVWNYPYAHHVHGYHRGELLFWFHDAFIGGELLIAPQIPQESVQAFCMEMAPKYEFLKSWPRGVDRRL